MSTSAAHPSRSHPSPYSSGTADVLIQIELCPFRQAISCVAWRKRFQETPAHCRGFFVATELFCPLDYPYFYLDHSFTLRWSNNN